MEKVSNTEATKENNCCIVTKFVKKIKSYLKKENDVDNNCQDKECNC